MRFPIFSTGNEFSEDLKATKIIFEYILRMDYKFDYTSDIKQHICHMNFDYDSNKIASGENIFYREAGHFLATPVDRASNDLTWINITRHIDYQSALSILYTVKTWQQKKPHLCIILIQRHGQRRTVII